MDMQNTQKCFTSGQHAHKAYQLKCTSCCFAAANTVTNIEKLLAAVMVAVFKYIRLQSGFIG